MEKLCAHGKSSLTNLLLSVLGMLDDLKRILVQL